MVLVVIGALVDELTSIVTSTTVGGTPSAAWSSRSVSPSTSSGAAEDVSGPITGIIATKPAVAAIVAPTRARPAGYLRRRRTGPATRVGSASSPGGGNATGSPDGTAVSGDPVAAFTRRDRSAASRSSIDGRGARGRLLSTSD
jgi:hypothetical protein